MNFFKIVAFFFKQILNGHPPGLEPIPVEVSLAPESAMHLGDQSGPPVDSSLGRSQLMGGGPQEGRLAGAIGQSGRAEDGALGQAEMETQLAGDMSQSDQSEEHSPGNQSQLIGTDAVLTQQVRTPYMRMSLY